jgi:hypothetical protein
MMTNGPGPLMDKLPKSHTPQEKETKIKTKNLKKNMQNSRVIFELYENHGHPPPMFAKYTLRGVLLIAEFSLRAMPQMSIPRKSGRFQCDEITVHRATSQCSSEVAGGDTFSSPAVRRSAV